MKNEIDKIYLPKKLWPVIHSFSGFCTYNEVIFNKHL